MVQYRLFCVDRHSRILHMHVFHATDDDAAFERARFREHLQHDCELWRGGKLIGRFHALAHDGI